MYILIPCDYQKKVDYIPEKHYPHAVDNGDMCFLRSGN